MPQISPLVIIIIAFALSIIFLKVAKKLFFHWIIFIILFIALLVVWPKALEYLASLVAFIRAVIIKK